MPFSLVPHRVMDRYADLTPAYLKEKGITLLLSDLDFTLAPKSVRRPDQPLRDWIGELKAGGIQFMIVSNNRSGHRVTEFCADLGVGYQGHAGKPSTRGLEEAMERAGKLDREAIKNEMYNTEYDGMSGYTTFDEIGDVLHEKELQTGLSIRIQREDIFHAMHRI